MRTHPDQDKLQENAHWHYEQTHIDLDAARDREPSLGAATIAQEAVYEKDLATRHSEAVEEVTCLDKPANLSLIHTQSRCCLGKLTEEAAPINIGASKPAKSSPNGQPPPSQEASVLLRRKNAYLWLIAVHTRARAEKGKNWDTLAAAIQVLCKQMKKAGEPK